ASEFETVGPLNRGHHIPHHVFCREPPARERVHVADRSQPRYIQLRNVFVLWICISTLPTRDTGAELVKGCRTENVRVVEVPEVTLGRIVTNEVRTHPGRNAGIVSSVAVVVNIQAVLSRP